MAINIAVGIYTLSSPLFPGSRVIHQGEAKLALNRYFLDEGEWWRLITAGFTHFGVAHLAMNMISLYFLGRFVEPAMGRTRFLALYLAAMLAGNAGALLMQPSLGLTAGASGAIFGLLGAAAVGLRQRGIPLMSSSIGTMIILNLIITFTISGISIGGHLGGLVGGALCATAMLAPRQKRVPAWAVWLLPIAVAAASVIIAFAVSHDALSRFR
jgi:membrane associated rhomboid family serine protease